MSNFKRRNSGNYKNQINRKRLRSESEWTIGCRTMSLKKSIINFITQLKELKND